MKSTLLLSILFFLITPYSVFAQQSAITSLSPTGYWLLDETTGTRYDVTANDNDLTDNNTVGYADGFVDNGADFEFSNSEWLSITDALQTGLDFSSYLTLSVWAKFESINTLNIFIAKANTSSNRSYMLGYHTSFGLYTYIVTSAGGYTANYNITTPTLDTWYHYVMVIDTVSGTADFYQDGEYLGQDTESTNAILDKTVPFTIGAHAWSSDSPPARYEFDGVLDEVAVFDTALDADDVTAIYDSYFQSATSSVSWCVYGNIFNMNSVTGQTCTVEGATTTCTYDLSPTTTAVQITSGDLIVGLGIIIFFLSMLFIGFVMKPFKRL